MKLTLRNKIEIALVAVVVCLGLIGAAVFLSVEHVQVAGTVHRDVRRAGKLLETYVRDKTETLTSQTQMLASLPTLKSALLAVDSGETVRQRFGAYASDMHVDGFYITDDQGSMVTADGDNFVSAKTAPAPEGVAAAQTGAKWSGVVVHGGGLYLAATVPVLVGDYVKATISVFSKIDSATAQRLSKDLGAEVVFVNGNTVAGSSIDAPKTVPTSVDKLIGIDSNNVHYVGYYAQFSIGDGSTAAGIVTMRKYDELVAPYQQMQLLLAAVLGLILCLSVVLSRTIAARVDSLIVGLVTAARMVRDGEWPKPFNVRRTDEIGLLQSAFNDMTASIQASHERLLSMIYIDPLTELANHRSFIERMEQESKRCAAANESLSLLLIDVDRLGEINSNFGHNGGDDAIKLIANHLTSVAPQFATVSRFGGDSFGVLLPRCDLDGADAFAQHALAGIKEIDTEYNLSVSIGCAQLGVSTSETDGLLLSAELALGRAKELGRGKVCRFDSVPGADASDDPYQVHRFLQDGTFGTIQALAEAVDAKDSYTRGHSTRVATYARDLAKYLGMTADEADEVYRAGTLHDVGKIGVPDKILKKTTPLDDEEIAIMQTHPGLGELIVRKAPQLETLLPGVRSHHERWDGKGYPDGLKGDEIPEMARMLAAADTFDAMTSDRPYRKGLSFDVALTEILRGGGTQFEPRIARAFVEMMLHSAEHIDAA